MAIIANINLSKYTIEGMYFLTLTKCLLTHQMSEHVNVDEDNEEKLEQTCLMTWGWKTETNYDH